MSRMLSLLTAMGDASRRPLPRLTPRKNLPKVGLEPTSAKRALRPERSVFAISPLRREVTYLTTGSMLITILVNCSSGIRMPVKFLSTDSRMCFLPNTDLLSGIFPSWAFAIRAPYDETSP